MGGIGSVSVGLGGISWSHIVGVALISLAPEPLAICVLIVVAIECTVGIVSSRSLSADVLGFHKPSCPFVLVALGLDCGGATQTISQTD